MFNGFQAKNKEKNKKELKRVFNENVLKILKRNQKIRKWENPIHMLNKLKKIKLKNAKRLNN